MKQKMPQSPFATRLSGSAKETELRLRNIFQWKKERPPVAALILAALVALSCGGWVSCRTSGEEISVDSDIVSPDSDDFMQEELPTQQLMDAVTYVTFDSINTSEIGTLRGYLPVSRVEDGIQLFTGSLWYQEAWDSILLDIPEADSLSKTDFVASNGIWDFFPVEVEHRTYTLESQPGQEEWITYFQEKLLEVEASDTPAVITEAWLFTWNGMETAVVNASNVIVSDDDSVYVAGRGEEHAQPNLPSREHTVIYRMSTLFMQGNAPIDIVTIKYGNHQEVSQYSDYNADLTKEGISYLPPDSGSYQKIFSAVQFDESGKLTVCPVFVSYGGELNTRQFQYSPAMCLVCDIDGDGEVELISGHNAGSALMCRYSVYKLINGKPECVFSLVG